MDLNALYFHHQVAIMKGAKAFPDAGDQSFFDLTAHYEKRIAEERASLGYSGHCSPETQHGSPAFPGAIMALSAL